MKTQIRVTEMPHYIDRFLHFLGCANHPLDAKNALSPLIAAYKKWLENPDPRVIPQDVLELSNLAVGVHQLKVAYLPSRDKQNIQSRLQSPDQVKGMLFEIRSALHYIQNSKNVQWLVSQDGQPRADLRIATPSGAVVYAECTQKSKSTLRERNRDALMQSILSTLARKMRQRREMRSPLHLVVFFPEEYNWAKYVGFNKDLGRRIQGRFQGNHRDKYAVITAITILCDEKPKISVNFRGQRYHDTSLPGLTYHNPHASYRFPSDFVHTIGD